MSPGQKRETKPKPRTHEHVSSPSDSPEARSALRRDGSKATARQLNEQKKVKTKKLAEEMDEILDEIDEVLETNAEEFVKSYVQKGGE
jgi:ubiquitin-like protein Pup